MRPLIPEFEAMRRRFPEEATPSLVLPCLRRIQEERGFVADSDIAELSAWLAVPRIQVEEVLGHYTMFRRAPIGRWHLQVCRNLSCSMRGAEGLLAQLQQRLGIAPGQTSPCGRYTLGTVECLGSCGTAPVMTVGETHHEQMSPERLDALLADLAQQLEQAP